MTPCINHPGAFVSDWHCQKRTELARRGRLPEEQAHACLACPRGGAENIQPVETARQAKTRRAMVMQARWEAQRQGARWCIVHREAMVRQKTGWVCRSCRREYARAYYHARKAKGPICSNP